MRQNQYEKLFDEFMDITEFSLMKHPDGSWSVWDRQGANLGTINDDRFDSAAQIFERMDIYIEDYFVDSLEQCLIESGFEIPEWSTYNDLIDYARPLLPDSKWACDILDMICNHFEEIDLNNCGYEQFE